jgi:hypothetical protein
MPICRLCQFDRELRNSHIVPEFLYKELYNDKNHMMGITGHGNLGWKPLQQGAKERLFCESCEQHFNKHCEEPFLAQWVNAAPLPNPWNITDIHWTKFDYISFKLFHLSVLFRASVSSLPTFAAVSLGPHEERLRRILQANNPGPYWQYPIFGHAVVHQETKALVPMVSQAVQSSFNGHRCYGMIYGGVQWWLCVSSHRNPEFELACLQEDGRMPFDAVPWNEVSVIQSAAEALRHPRLRNASVRSDGEL